MISPEASRCSWRTCSGTGKESELPGMRILLKIPSNISRRFARRGSIVLIDAEGNGLITSPDSRANIGKETGQLLVDVGTALRLLSRSGDGDASLSATISVIPFIISSCLKFSCSSAALSSVLFHSLNRMFLSSIIISTRFRFHPFLDSRPDDCGREQKEWACEDELSLTISRSGMERVKEMSKSSATVRPH